MAKTSLYFDKPIFDSATVLDLSKEHMYAFHFDYVLKRYSSDHAHLLFTDTDSLTYWIRTDDVYADMKEDMAERFDTCDYPPTHPCFSKQNAKRLGFFKDETNGVPILEFIGLRAKMYSIRLGDDSTKLTAKDIDRGFVKKHIKHERYRMCLKQYQRTSAQFKTIRSQRQELFTMDISKIGLSPYDDKRYLLKDSHETLAFGHYRIPKKWLFAFVYCCLLMYIEL